MEIKTAVWWKTCYVIGSDTSATRQSQQSSSMKSRAVWLGWLWVTLVVNNPQKHGLASLLLLQSETQMKWSHFTNKRRISFAHLSFD